MKSKLLNKLATRKTGWRPEAIFDTETKVMVLDACMVTNGHVHILVKAGTDIEGLFDRMLEQNVIRVIKECEEKDNLFIQKQTIIFSALASASVGQAQCFVGMIDRAGKMELNRYINSNEHIIKTIQSEAIKVVGPQMKELLEGIEDSSFVLFQSFCTAMEIGKAPEFLEHVKSFFEHDR